MADDLSSNPTFTALPSKAGSEWYVLVSWHDGRVPELPGERADLLRGRAAAELRRRSKLTADEVKEIVVSVMPEIHLQKPKA